MVPLFDFLLLLVFLLLLLFLVPLLEVLLFLGVPLLEGVPWPLLEGVAASFRVITSSGVNQSLGEVGVILFVCPGRNSTLIILALVSKEIAFLTVCWFNMHVLAVVEMASVCVLSPLRERLRIWQ